MKQFVAAFPLFSKIFESFKEQNYPQEMIKSLKDKKKVKLNPKITKPNFKG